MVPELKIRLYPQLKCGEPKFRQVAAEAVAERRTGYVAEWRSAPESERPAKNGGTVFRARLSAGQRHVGDEPVGVDGLRIGVQGVAVGAGLQAAHVRIAARHSQTAAQTGHVHVKRGAWIGGHPVVPQEIDQPIGVHRLADVEQQDRQQQALLPPTKLQEPPIAVRDDGSEQTELPVITHRRCTR